MSLQEKFLDPPEKHPGVAHGMEAEIKNRNSSCWWHIHLISDFSYFLTSD